LIEQVENGQSSFKKQSLFEPGHAAHKSMKKVRGKERQRKEMDKERKGQKEKLFEGGHAATLFVNPRIALRAISIVQEASSR